jgi:hypothetical protein
MTALSNTQISDFRVLSPRPQKIRLTRQIVMVAAVTSLFKANESFAVLLALTFLYILAIFANSTLYRLEKRLRSLYTGMSSYQYNPTVQVVQVVGLIILLCKWIYIFVR